MAEFKALADVDINKVSNRVAMGLPDHFVPSAISNCTMAIAALRGKSTEDLLAKVEGTSASIIERYAAGTLLSLGGDPRLDVFSPPMTEVIGGEAIIGLEPENFDSVCALYRDIGVREDWVAKEVPAHKCALSPYRIGIFPVTNLEYVTFVTETEFNELPTSWTYGAPDPAKANHPVHSVSWEAAAAYCSWLSKKTRRRFRLPSEAEWEFAAAGPSGLEFPWGNTYLPDHANTIEGRLFTSSPVGIFPRGRSPFGCYDMAGNVEEYTRDSYAPYPGGRFIADDLTQKYGEYKVARGGSFTRFRDLARCKRRHGQYNRDLYVLGFRLCEDVDAGATDG